MMQVQWRLRDYLTQHGLTAYKLAKALPELRQPTVYRLASDRSPQSVNLELLGKVMQGLKSLTGEEVTPNDLLEVVHVAEAASTDSEPIFSGTVQKWKKKAPQAPYVPGLDSTALLAELREERQ
ncbi:helix-turn-helix transcriptional regulator [Deinococcus sp.]|uniref:helix-turn-helix domain-containing protein n=1 Tax=Deinococcus sp. TaxID=47478 RepID=UPI0025BD9743|nr:helix-turn-helix transcriptional regulator [Deinococcus sp.]